MKDRSTISSTVFVLLLLSAIACSGHRKTTVTSEETVEQVPVSTETSVTAADTADVQTETFVSADGTKKVTKRTVEETESDSASCSGVFSCTFHVIGEIIALPFRAIGGLIRLLF